MNKTTDNQEEMFDVVDEKDNVIGQATRAQCNANRELIHRSVSIAIFNDKGEIFLQKRSRTKDTGAGKWTLSCSGHLEQGQEYNDTAQRELQEELGIQTPLKLVKKHITYLPNETEMNSVYKGKHSGPFNLHPLEIETCKFFSTKELNQKVKSGKIKLTPQSAINLRKVLNILK